MTESKDQPNKPLLGCSEWSLREIPLSNQFQLLNEIGIHSMEIGLGGDHTGHLSDSPTSEEVKEVQEQRQQHQIETPFCAIECNLTESDPAKIKQTIESFRNRLEIAAQLDIQTVNLTISFCPSIDVDEERWKRLTEAIQSLDTQAKENGLRFALTTRGLVEEQSEEGVFYIETIMTNRESLARLAPCLPSSIGFAYEPGMFKAVNPSDLRLGLEIVQERVEVCFLQDWKQYNRFLKQSVIGADDLNYASLLPKLPIETPYLLSVPPSSSVKSDLQRSLDYLKRIRGDGQ